MTNDPVLLNAREAAKLLHCSERTIWTLTAPRGPIPCIKITPRVVRYEREDLIEFLARKKAKGYTHTP